MKVFRYVAFALENLGGNSSNPMNDILAKNRQKDEERKYQKQLKFENALDRKLYQQEMEDESKAQLKHVGEMNRLLAQRAQLTGNMGEGMPPQANPQIWNYYNPYYSMNDPYYNNPFSQ